MQDRRLVCAFSRDSQVLKIFKQLVENLNWQDDGPFRASVVGHIFQMDIV